MPSNGTRAESKESGRLKHYRSLLQGNKRDLEMSWQRCMDAGMKPQDRPEPIQIMPGDLASVYVEQAARVRALALAEIRILYKQLGRHGFTLTLANADSVILDRIPGRDIVDGRASGDDLAPGNCWYETARGTNALGTAANSGHTIVVSGGDHYLRAYHDLICIAKPVFTASGDMAAIIDATSHRHNGRMDPHEMVYVLGLMHMSAEHIETELFKEQHQNSVVIQTNTVSKSLASGNAAFAFDHEGRLENASRGALASFEDLDVRIGCHFEQIFRMDFPAVAQCADSPVDFLEIEDRKGGHHYATVYFPASGRDRTDGAFRPDRSPQKYATAQREPHAENADFMGADSAVARAMETVERATELGAPILIRGETGTGKELLARYIHRLSGRAGQIVNVNCAAVPESLIEAELFGYEQGAFTGARRGGSRGLVRQADGGTLFLDEIGDMPFELQGRLLRLLDSWRVRPVGSEAEYEVDVHLVTATNQDLEQAVADSRFRKDLLHRIQVVEVRLPALRERADFDEIAHALLHDIKPGARLDADAVAQLRARPWQGNMRELRNMLTRLLIRADGGVITRAIVGREAGTNDGFVDMNGADHRCGPIDNAAVEAAFRQCRGNVAATARQLGVSRTTVYNHLRRLKKTDPEG